MKNYFSHDSAARDDEKILALRMKHGWEGYGLYWALVEKLREATDYKLTTDYNVIAYDLRVSSAIIKSIINDFGLFAFSDDGKYFYSSLGVVMLPKITKNSLNGRVRMYKTNVKRWYEIINEVFKRDNYTCQYCGQVGGLLEADHIVAFSKGGSDEMDNLTTACRRCNRQKRNKSVKEFKIWLDRLKKD